MRCYFVTFSLLKISRVSSIPKVGRALSTISSIPKVVRALLEHTKGRKGPLYNLEHTEVERALLDLISVY